MAITRRQFVTRMGALAAAAGLSQSQISQIVDAVAYDSTLESVYKGTFGKPRVVWIHGAECTGCSTSLLSFLESPTGEAVVGTGITTLDALKDAGTLPTTTESGAGNNSGNPLFWAAGWTPDSGYVDIADVVVDVIDLLYHETIMGPAGDLAYQWLANFKANNGAPYVLVVEGALQKKSQGGAWDDSSTASKDVPWCSIGMADTPGAGEIDMSQLVQDLAEDPDCLAIFAIGQCATFGGYPGCRPPITTTAANGFDPLLSQTGALGTYDYLAKYSTLGVKAKVVNVPGCPTNPWWFVLSVLLVLIDLPSVLGKANGTAGTLGILSAVTQPSSAFATFAPNNTSPAPNADAIDGTGRLKFVYGTPIHSPYCPRYRDFVAGKFASHPGDAGCLQLIGCKGPATNSLCGYHGWNAQQPQNTTAEFSLSQMNPAPDGIHYQGGHCTRAGHPCMACTEKGYPDSFVPFVKL